MSGVTRARWGLAAVSAAVLTIASCGDDAPEPGSAASTTTLAEVISETRVITEAEAASLSDDDGTTPLACGDLGSMTWDQSAPTGSGEGADPIDALGRAIEDLNRVAVTVPSTGWVELVVDEGARVFVIEDDAGAFTAAVTVTGDPVLGVWRPQLAFACLAQADPGALLRWSSTGLANFPWGSDRDAVVSAITAALGHGPDYASDDIGPPCLAVTGSTRHWERPRILLFFDLDGRLGSALVELDAAAHAGDLRTGDSFDQLLRVEPSAAWAGPIRAPGTGAPDYFEWTVTNEDTIVRGRLTGPPPDGRIENIVMLEGPYDPRRCGA